MAFVPAPGYQPAFNPPVPYTTMIAGGLRVGMAVFIQAVVPSKHNRFTVNLSTGQYEGSDIALHLNARYDGRDRVVFNSLQGGAWGDEEMKREMPFKPGKVFQLLFEVTRNNYQVSVNCAPFYEFGHRIPLERVQWLQVSGDITLQSLCIIGSGPAVKGGLLMSGPQGELPPMLGPPILNPAMPFTTNIRGGMIPKRTVVIKGVVNSNAKSFIINFKVGFSNDIALHINPRISKSTVIRNSFVNGAWGQEENELPLNPFKQGDFFDISVRSGEKRFKVFVNGQHLFNYEHRMWTLQQIDTLEVEGDVKLCFVHL
ncbi:galectin-4-like [Spea bombifrons]|uniref:galectin-4-like n=1 Tax=Spea bombifrons TaxID=233779 RepID=UPI00234B28E4|nr:galectin-4-like [Spea bombifrons]